jgi:hypothetical protein
VPPVCTAQPDANGCIFLGFPGTDQNGSGHWDAGVIKIDNPLPSTPLVVQSVTVDIGTSTTGIWGAFFPLTIPPGGTLILTQVGNLFNFDTSDFPQEGSEEPPPIGSCTPDGDIPLINVTVGTGTTKVIRTFSDTGQVLNTKGFDLGLCGVPGGGGPPTNEGQEYSVLTEVSNKCACEKDSPVASAPAHDPKRKKPKRRK